MGVLYCRHEIKTGYGIKRSAHMSEGTGAFLMPKEARSVKREVIIDFADSMQNF